MIGKIAIKRTLGCLALGLAALFAAMDSANAGTNEIVRLVSADLQLSAPAARMRACAPTGSGN